MTTNTTSLWTYVDAAIWAAGERRQGYVHTAQSTVDVLNADRIALGERWANIRALAREAHDQKVAARSKQAPSLTLHAADYGLAPVRRWGMCDRAVETHRLARVILALARRQGSAAQGDTAWSQAAEVFASKSRRARIAAYVASTHA